MILLLWFDICIRTLCSDPYVFLYISAPSCLRCESWHQNFCSIFKYLSCLQYLASAQRGMGGHLPPLDFYLLRLPPLGNARRRKWGKSNCPKTGRFEYFIIFQYRDEHENIFYDMRLKTLNPRLIHGMKCGAALTEKSHLLQATVTTCKACYHTFHK